MAARRCAARLPRGRGRLCSEFTASIDDILHEFPLPPDLASLPETLRSQAFALTGTTRPNVTSAVVHACKKMMTWRQASGAWAVEFTRSDNESCSASLGIRTIVSWCLSVILASPLPPPSPQCPLVTALRPPLYPGRFSILSPFTPSSSDTQVKAVFNRPDRVL